MKHTVSTCAAGIYGMNTMATLAENLLHDPCIPHNLAVALIGAIGAGLGALPLT